jgi:hypothetical protein
MERRASSPVLAVGTLASPQSGEIGIAGGVPPLTAQKNQNLEQSGAASIPAANPTTPNQPSIEQLSSQRRLAMV